MMREFCHHEAFSQHAINHPCFTPHCLPSIHTTHCPQMPWKQREIPIRKYYSEDLKQRVIYQAFTLAKKSTEIAIDLDMPVHVVQRVKRTWMEIGHVCHTRRFLGRHPLLSPNEVVVSTYVRVLLSKRGMLLSGRSEKFQLYDSRSSRSSAGVSALLGLGVTSSLVVSAWGQAGMVNLRDLEVLEFALWPWAARFLPWVRPFAIGKMNVEREMLV